MSLIQTSFNFIVISTLFLSGCSQKVSDTESSGIVKISGKITIKRDSYGTPHIYAKDNYGLFYGYGYSVAQDRLYQMEILRHSTQGTVAEILGEHYISFDKNQRTLFWPEDISNQVSKLDKETLDVFSGFAAGLNAYIKIVQDDESTLLPLEFNENEFKPQEWTEYDVVMLFVGSMLLRYGDFNTEIDNQNFLSSLIDKHGSNAAQSIFDAIMPVDNALAPTTIAGLDFLDIKTQAPIKQQTILPKFIGPLFRAPKPGHGFSNALVLGPSRLKDAKAVLINGPQFGWYVPAYTYSIGFHSPDWTAIGNAPLGYPLPMFGHNEYIAWGTTWGASDNVDIFRETLNPDNPLVYKYKGKWQSYETRQEVIKVKNSNDVAFTASRSVHGPIIFTDTESNYAYAKSRGWTGRELNTIIGWMEATKAKNHKQWLDAVEKSALNVNWYYADQDGNIGYMSTGAYPVRHSQHDSRLPVSGEGVMDWQGFYPPSWNPQVFNPSTGYIANWNNKPRPGFKNPDEWWYSWSEADRIKVLDDAVDNAKIMTPLQAWNLMLQAGYVDPNASYFLPLMLAALKNNDDPRMNQIADILKNWDGQFKDTEHQGTSASTDNTYMHPANAIFRAWLGQMLHDVLSDDLPGQIGQALSTTTGYGTPEKPTAAGTNISVGTKLLYETLQERGDYDFRNGVDANALWLTSLDKALVILENKYGKNIEDWKLPVPATRFNDTNFLGIPQTLPREELDDMPDMNRGTENNMTVFNGARTPIGYEVVAPGQSGFIAPDGSKTKNYADQYELFRDHGKKRTWISDADISDSAISEITLSYHKN